MSKKDMKKFIIDNLRLDLVVLFGRKYAYLCKNNGQAHKGKCQNIPGYASFVGKYEIEDLFYLVKNKMI